MKDWLYQDITSDIIGAYYKIFNTFKYRRGYSEENFAQALMLELTAKGRRVTTQVAVQRRYAGRRIGLDFVDLVIDEKVAIEVKKVSTIKEEHCAQLRTYLIDGEWSVGLLLNFGSDAPEFRRLEKRADQNRISAQEKRG